MRRLPAILGATVALAGLFAGCGGGGGSSATGGNAPPAAKPAGKPDTAAVRAVQSYLDAYSTEKPKAICALLASTVRAQLTEKGNCVRTVRSTLKTTSPRLKVDRAYRSGSNAVVTIKGSTRQVKVVLEKGQWKVIDGGT